MYRTEPNNGCLPQKRILSLRHLLRTNSLFLAVSCVHQHLWQLRTLSLCFLPQSLSKKKDKTQVSKYLLVYVEQKEKLKALIASGQCHRKPCVGRLEAARTGSLEGRASDAGHMQTMKAWAAVEQRGRGTGARSGGERRKQGAHCGLHSERCCSPSAPGDPAGLSPSGKADSRTKMQIDRGILDGAHPASSNCRFINTERFENIT